MYDEFDDYENKLATNIAEKMTEKMMEAKAKVERALRNKLSKERRIKSSIFLDANLDPNGCVILSNNNVQVL